MESTGSIDNLGTKVVFRTKMCGKNFYAMNNFGTAQFLLFVIDAWNTILKLSYSFKFHSFINRSVLRYSFRAINNMPLIL